MGGIINVLNDGRLQVDYRPVSYINLAFFLLYGSETMISREKREVSGYCYAKGQP